MSSYKQVGSYEQLRKTAGDSQVLPKGQSASNVYSAAVSMGYPKMTGEGRSSKEGDVWLTESKNAAGESIWIGYSDKLKKFVYEK